MRKPWVRTKSKLVHKNRWFSLREDDVIRPDGAKGKYFYIDDVNSVSIIAEDSDKKIYLVGQTRYPIGNFYSWEIPTGGCKKGLSALAEAKRELKEETGLEARKWIKLGYFHPANGYSGEMTTIFFAAGLTLGKQNLDPTEDIYVKKESLKNILKKIKENKITDGLTINSILKYLIYKRKIKK